MASKTAEKPVGAGSAYYVPFSPNGFAFEDGPAGGLAFHYNHLAAALKQEAKQHAPAMQRLNLKYARKTEDGTWALIDRGSIEAVPSFESKRPGAVFKQGGVGGEALDDFMAGPTRGTNYLKAPDSEVWQYTVELLNELGNPPMTVVRSIFTSVSLALGVRCGLDLDESDLPHPGQ